MHRSRHDVYVYLLETGKNGTFLAWNCDCSRPQNTPTYWRIVSCQSIVPDALYTQLSSVRACIRPAAMITASYHDDDDFLVPTLFLFPLFRCTV